MALMLGDLYAAVREAGASPELAGRAAEEVAAYCRPRAAERWTTVRDALWPLAVVVLFWGLIFLLIFALNGPHP